MRRIVPLAVLILISFLVVDAFAASQRGPKSQVNLLAFEAKWCAACKKMEPKLKSIEKKGYHVHRVDVDTPRGRELAKRYRVKELPTYVVVDENGREQGREVGVVSEGVLLALLRIARTVAITLIKLIFF